MNKTIQKKKHLELVDLRPMTENDLEFLYRIFSDTRIEELGLNEWPVEEAEKFIRILFQRQHKQYMDNDKDGRIDVILFDQKPVGRLYVHSNKNDIRFIDISLLKEYRCKGIGAMIMRKIIEEFQKKQHPFSLHVELNNPSPGGAVQAGFKKRESNGVYYYMERPVSGI
jgi:RimJ/RimL family protein N-acetyltransferase